MRQSTGLLALLLLGLAEPGCQPPAEAREDAPQSFPDAVAADPGHYSVVFENEQATMLRVRYGPGETSVMHRHPESCAVFVTDQSARFLLPSGDVQEGPAEAGDVICGPGEAHVPTNTGSEPFELILVEFKAAPREGT